MNPTQGKGPESNADGSPTMSEDSASNMWQPGWWCCCCLRCLQAEGLAECLIKRSVPHPYRDAVSPLGRWLKRTPLYEVRQ